MEQGKSLWFHVSFGSSFGLPFGLATESVVIEKPRMEGLTEFLTERCSCRAECRWSLLHLKVLLLLLEYHEYPRQQVS